MVFLRRGVASPSDYNPGPFQCTFPAKTRLIGTSCFEGCTTLQTVGADANLTNLRRVTSDNGSGQNNADNNTGFKQIGDYAFYKCTNLQNFDFSKFTDY